ncbi:hypothetical protein ACSSS7_000893 [Eimeria intestinalis]
MQRLLQQQVLLLPPVLLLLLLLLRLCVSAEALTAPLSAAAGASLAASTAHATASPAAAARGPACAWLARVKPHPRGPLMSAAHSSNAAGTDTARHTFHLSSAANKQARTKPSAAAAAAGPTGAAAAAAGPTVVATATTEAASGPTLEEDDDADINVEYVSSCLMRLAAAPAAVAAVLSAVAAVPFAVAAAAGALNPRVPDMTECAVGVNRLFCSQPCHLKLSKQDYPFVGPPGNLVINEDMRVQQQQEQQEQQQQRLAAYHAQHPSSRSRRSRRSKRIYVASELLQHEEPDLIVKGENWDDGAPAAATTAAAATAATAAAATAATGATGAAAQLGFLECLLLADFEVYTDHSLTERVDPEPPEVQTDLLEYEKLHRGLGPWPPGFEVWGLLQTIAEAMMEAEKWAAREEQPRHGFCRAEWVLDKEEEELLEPRVLRVYQNLKQHFNPDTRERFARFAGEGFVSAGEPLPLLELNQKPALNSVLDEDLSCLRLSPIGYVWLSPETSLQQQHVLYRCSSSSNCSSSCCCYCCSLLPLAAAAAAAAALPLLPSIARCCPSFCVSLKVSPSTSKNLFFLDASYAYANPPSPSGADMGQGFLDRWIDIHAVLGVYRQVVAYGWPPKVRRAFSGFTLLDCSWEQQRLLLPLQVHQQQQQHSSIVTAQDLRRILQMIKHRLQDLADLECLPLLDAFDIQVAAVPTPPLQQHRQQQQQQQQQQQRLELVGRRELTIAAGSWVHVHYASPEAAAAVVNLPRAAAAAALAACARMHAATAAAEGAAAGQSLLQRLLQHRQQPLPPIEEEDARDYIKPMGACELTAAPADSVGDAAAAAPAYAVAAAANRLSPQAFAPSLSFLKQAVKSSRQQQQQQGGKQQREEREHQQQHQQQPCVLLGSPNATCLFYARGGDVFLTSLDAVEKASLRTLSPCLLLHTQSDLTSKACNVVRNHPTAAAAAAAAAAATAAATAADVDIPEGRAAAAATNEEPQLFSAEEGPVDPNAAAAATEAAAAAATEAAAAAAAFAALPLEDSGDTAGNQEDWLEAEDALDE